MTASFVVIPVLGGALSGFSLGLLGVGSGIMVVPLLVYALHVPPHLAIGTSTAAATFSALWSLSGHARAGTVRWRYGATYAAASVLGAATGARLGKATASHILLLLLGILMIVVAALMLRKALRARSGASKTETHRTRLAVGLLAVAGFAVGAFAGLVGVGGGFLTVPVLVFITGMPVLNAVGSSLVSVAAVAATTATSYAFSHLVEWHITGLLMIGALVGGYVGVKLANRLGAYRRALTLLFSSVVALAGLYVLVRAVASMH